MDGISQKRKDIIAARAFKARIALASLFSSDAMGDSGQHAQELYSDRKYFVVSKDTLLNEIFYLRQIENSATK